MRSSKPIPLGEPNHASLKTLDFRHSRLEWTEWIRNADRVVVLQDGKIAEVGTFAELVQLNGLFSRMLEAQELGTIDMKELDLPEKTTV